MARPAAEASSATYAANNPSEDAAIVAPNLGGTGYDVFAVLDGHGGRACAQHVVDTLPDIVKDRLGTSLREWPSLKLHEALRSSFDAVEASWEAKVRGATTNPGGKLAKGDRTVGSCALVMGLVPQKDEQG